MKGGQTVRSAGSLDFSEAEGTFLKRFFRLAIAAIWFTAPVISLLFMRNGSSDAGSYPFSAMFTCLYELLHFATDMEFVTIVLGMTVFWIALGAASLLVDRFSAMKILLLTGATAELLIALASGANLGTVVLDAVFIAMVHIVGKKQNKASVGLRSESRLYMQTSEKSSD